MNDQEKAYLRRALEAGILTIDQVDEIRRDMQRAGKPLREVLSAGTLLALPMEEPVTKAPGAFVTPAAPPPPVTKPPGAFVTAGKIPPLYAGLLAASCLIFAGLLLATVTKMREKSRHDDELAVEQSKNMAIADREAAEALAGYQRSVIERREDRAKQALAKAREAMRRVGDKPATTPDVVQALNEAFVGYNAYLEVLPDDADVRIERAKTHQLRRNYDLAITDLERAAQLKPDMAPALQERIAQLRLFLARTPK